MAACPLRVRRDCVRLPQGSAARPVRAQRRQGRLRRHLTMTDPADRQCPDISDGDIYEAMKEIPGYLDITPADLKEIYRHAFRHARERINRPVKAAAIMTRIVHHVRVDTPLKEVAELMARRRISGVPVLDAGRPGGGGHLRKGLPEPDGCARHGARHGHHRSLPGRERVRRSADPRQDCRGHHGNARHHRPGRHLDARNHGDLRPRGISTGHRWSTARANSSASSRAPISSARRRPRGNSAMKAYFEKMQGTTTEPPSRQPGGDRLVVARRLPRHRAASRSPITGSSRRSTC